MSGSSLCRSKKRVNQNCSDNNNIRKQNYFDRDDWNTWLNFVKNFYSYYKIFTILDNKPAHDDRPYVNIKINDTNACGLLDSGAAVSILGNNSHQELNLPLCQDDSIKLVAAGGQSLVSLGYMNLPITFEGNAHIIKTFVVPEVDTPLILGIDFWKKFELCPKYLGSLDITMKGTCPLSLLSVSDSEDHVTSYGYLDEGQRKIADDIVSQFNEISLQKKGLGRTSLITHRIDTGNSVPIRQRYYRMSPTKQRILTEEVDEMLKLDVVEPCESEWSSPVLIVYKKDGKPRFCLDSRKLNSVTKKDAYSLPYISEILDNLRDARFLSSIDLSKAFWQIPIHEQDRDKTAFYVPGRGTLRFKTTAFGLTNAPATQQRLADKLFGPEFDLKIFAYLDDIIVVSSDFEEHVSLLRSVLEKLQLANLTINSDKCQFFRSELKYLGYVVDAKGLRTDPEKVEAILNYPTPTCRKDVKRFLGTATWYRRFVPKFSTIAGPLNKLTSTNKKAPPFVWTPEADNAFNQLKSCLVSAPVLACPDFSKPFEVHTDASNYGVGGMLTQTIDGVERPVAYMSKSLTGAEKNYSITERETLAVLTALEHWRCYLDNGQTFTVYTDHSALKWFLSLSNPTGRLARWCVRLSSFNFVIKHRKGVDNVIPDALSRAFPVSAINTSNTFTTTTDSWYKKMYQSCINNPVKLPNFTIKNNKLFRLSRNKCRLTSEFSWKEVIPFELRDQVIKENHSEPTAGHLGIHKTYYRVALNYFWPGMHSDVVKFVSGCPSCLSYKLPNHSTLGEMGRPKQCSRPFQMISIDFVGPLPSSRKQNTFLLVVVCCFSKYCLLFPMRRATAEGVIKHLEDSVFLVHGIPQSIFLDNGSQFISHNLENFFKKYNVPNVCFTPKYTPQINTVERYNKTIVTCISTFIEDDHRSWDIHLPKIQFAINNSVNEATGFTPSFLVHGRELVTCGSHYLDSELDNELVFLPREDYVENLGFLAPIFDRVQASLWQAHQKNVSRYNLRRKQAEFEVGDIVWKKTYFQSDKDKFFAKKLAPKFIKCRVILKKSPLVYQLEDMSGNNLGTWHIKDFKLTNST